MASDAHPSYLSNLQHNIRLRVVPWEGYIRSNVISEAHALLIRSLEKVHKPEERRALVDAKARDYAQLFVGSSSSDGAFIAANQRVDVLQHLLVLFGDLLEKAVYATGQPYDDLLVLLARSNNPEDPIPILAAHVLATLMCNSSDESPNTLEHALPLLLTHLSGFVKGSDSGLKDAAVQQYSYLLYSRTTRKRFWLQRSETVEPLIGVLRNSAGVGSSTRSTSALWTSNTSSSSSSTSASSSVANGVGSGTVSLQLLYHVLLVLWQLGFDAAQIGDELDDEYDIIALYKELLRSSPKEKAIRLIVSTLLSLLQQNQKTLLPTAVLARLPFLVETIRSRHWTDPDLEEDLKQLSEILDEYTKTKTTFDEYVAEIESGHLRWSPPHRNQTFWTENARRIADHENGAILQQLATIMKKPWDHDKQVLAIACNDIGSIIREVPEKRYPLDRLGVKTRIMELMQEDNETVRWESLKALGGWLKYSFESTK